MQSLIVVITTVLVQNQRIFRGLLVVRRELGVLGKTDRPTVVARTIVAAVGTAISRRGRRGRSRGCVKRDFHHPAQRAEGLAGLVVAAQADPELVLVQRAEVKQCLLQEVLFHFGDDKHTSIHAIVDLHLQR